MQINFKLPHLSSKKINFIMSINGDNAMGENQFRYECKVTEIFSKFRLNSYANVKLIWKFSRN